VLQKGPIKVPGRDRLPDRALDDDLGAALYPRSDQSSTSNTPLAQLPLEWQFSIGTHNRIVSLYQDEEDCGKKR
jgi:hypothetical protein